MLRLALFLAVASQAAEIRIQIVCDNTSARPGLEAHWGLAAVVESRGHRILFDSGADPGMLAGNLAKLGIDPATFEQVVISHSHLDHTAGLRGIKPVGILNLLDSFPKAMFDAAATAGWKTRRVEGPIEVQPDVWTTGEIEGNPPEQALVIRTAKGLAILTGCSHPGIVKMVERVKQQRGAERVRLLAGGFHLLNHDSAGLQAIASRLKALGVESIVPSHCTGAAAIALFQKEWGSRFESGGAGKLIRLEE